MMDPMSPYRSSKKAPRRRRNLPRKRLKTSSYVTTGVVLVKADKSNDITKILTIDGKTCYEKNWHGHATPDQLPDLRELPETHLKVLEILVHRAKGRYHPDVKLSDRVIAEEVGICERHVRRVIDDLTEMGFIGRCWGRFRKGDKYTTWRMIRVHVMGWINRWDFYEDATHLRSDFRPDSHSLKALNRQYAEPFGVRVVKSGRIHPRWVHEDDNVYDGMLVKPAWSNTLDLFNLVAKGAWHPAFDTDFGPVQDAYETFDPWAKRIVGKRPNLERGIVF